MFEHGLILQTEGELFRLWLQCTDSAVATLHAQVWFLFTPERLWHFYVQVVQHQTLLSGTLDPNAQNSLVRNVLDILLYVLLYHLQVHIL